MLICNIQLPTLAHLLPLAGDQGTRHGVGKTRSATVLRGWWPSPARWTRGRGQRVTKEISNKVISIFTRRWILNRQAKLLRVCPCATPPAPLTSLALSTPPLFTSKRNTSPNSIRLNITAEVKIKLLVKFIQVKIRSTAKPKAFGRKKL